MNTTGRITLTASIFCLALGLTRAVTANPELIPGVWKEITPIAGYWYNDIRVDPSNPSTLYTCGGAGAALLKSTDAGSTWNDIGSGPFQKTAQYSYVDPNDPLHMYVICGVINGGFYVTKDGGKNWFIPESWSAGAQSTWTDDCYWLAPHPQNFDHILMTFHSPWKNVSTSRVLEGITTDKGTTWTWTTHGPTSGWDNGLTINYLWDPDKNIGDSLTWLVGTQWGGGYYRTSDAGATWTNVSTQLMMHAGTGIYYSKTGVLYSGANQQMMRSTNNGISWTLIGPRFADGYYQIIGDGNFMYAQEANTGFNTVGPQPYIVSPETDGINWTPYSYNGTTQTFGNGPHRMEFDSVNRIIYSANDKAGLWALKVAGTTPVEHKVAPVVHSGSVVRSTIGLKNAGIAVRTAGNEFFDVKGRNLQPR